MRDNLCSMSSQRISKVLMVHALGTMTIGTTFESTQIVEISACGPKWWTNTPTSTGRKQTIATRHFHIFSACLLLCSHQVPTRCLAHCTHVAAVSDRQMGSGWVAVCRKRRNVPGRGGQISVTHQPTPQQALAPHARSHLTTSPICEDLCSLHDIKAIWINVEQSPGLSRGHRFKCSRCWGRRGRKAVCYWMCLVSITAWREESFS